jgi:hypothetical protein
MPLVVVFVQLIGYLFPVLLPASRDDCNDLPEIKVAKLIHLVRIA